MARDNVMTEQEAVEKIKDLSDRGYPTLRKAKEMAISVLKEIQQYRKIGTIEELKYFKDMKVRLEKYHANISVSRLLECFIETVFENTRHEGFIILTNQEAEDYEAYCSIGTVEECREAVEKQKPKKPHRNYKKFSGLWCKCGWYLGQKQCLDIKYCPNCGQAIDENLEGIEDE